MINENQITPYQASELPVNEGPWLVFAPHADDETFGMGGSILKAVERGIDVSVVIMTDGALGGDQEGLAQVRKSEAIAATKELGIGEPAFLDYQDRGLAINADSINRVKTLIANMIPAAVFFPGVFELHPDHRTTAALVWQALQQLGPGIPVPVAYEVLTQSPVNVLVDITACMPGKEAAMIAYQSQLDEKRYIEVAKALNTLRSLTLSDDVTFAEGFYRYETADIKRELTEVHLDKIRRLFEH